MTINFREMNRKAIINLKEEFAREKEAGNTAVTIGGMF
jgi:hypothetical protein